MSRRLQVLNLIGILALIGLCCVQWEQNRELHARWLGAEQRNDEQAAKIAEDNKTIQGYVADLDDFRGRLAAADAAEQEAERKLKIAAADRDRLSADRDQLATVDEALKSTIGKWEAAVAARDEALKKAGALAQQLATDRNDAVMKYNDLVGKYNAAADEIKKAAGDIQKLIAERNDAVTRFNDLAKKYNALMGGSGDAATRP